MDSDVPRQVAEERRAALMETQRRISRERLRELEGREIEVLVEAQAGPGRMTGRSERDAPEVDGLVELSGSGIRPGEIVRAKVVETGDHDLKAVAAGCV